MAAPARTAKRKSTKPSKRSTSSSDAQTLFSLPRALGRAGTATIRWARMSTIPEQVKREIIAIITVCCAGLLTLSIAGYGGRMSVVGEIVEGLRWLIGRGAIFAPIAFAWIAIELMIGTEVGPRRRRLFGLFFFAASIIAFLDLIVVPIGPRAGGKVGEALGGGARLVAGDVGAGIICFAVGMIGVYLVTSVHSGEVLDAWRRSRDIRQARAQLRREAREKAAEQIAKERRATAKRTPIVNEAALQTPTQGAPTADTVEQRPVINMPKRRKAAKETDVAMAPAVEPSGEAPAPAPLPDIQKLALYESGSPESLELESKAELITETLKNFKVDASVREIFPGPAVTLFALEPGPGTKVRRITELQNDLALALAARSIRIEAPVPGMARVGIELPNADIHTVGLRETIESIEFQSSKAHIPLALGRDVNGSYIIADLARMPHLLIAGSTGSGKSVCINGIISTLLLNRRPEELQMVMIDPKMVELTGFNGVPHLKCPVVTEMNKVVGTLRLVLKEMDDRYQRFSMLGVRNIDGYNLRREEDPSLEMMSYIVVIIDELADLMLTTPEEVETLLVRLAQMARATGIHLEE